jgi:plastocyanin
MLRLVIAVGALLLATACSAPTAAESPVAAGTQFTVRVDNSMQFSPAALAVQAGQPLELTLENVGDMTHDLSLSDGIGQPVKIEAAGGHSATARVIFQQPGTYTFTCSQPAHALAGMKGTAVVR